mgnify:CR=1 FL=1
MLKWCDTVDKGWAYMKSLIEEKIAKIEKQIEKARAQESDLHIAQSEFSTDHEKLAEVTRELAVVTARIDELEEQWLLTSSLYEQHLQQP